MALALSVVKAFEEFQRGQHITDPDVIAEIKGGAYAHNVVQCILPDDHVAALNAKAAAEKAKSEPADESAESTAPEVHTETPASVKGKAKTTA